MALAFCRLWGWGWVGVTQPPHDGRGGTHPLTYRLEDDNQERQQVQEQRDDHHRLPAQAVAEVAEERGREELDAALHAVAHAG